MRLLTVTCALLAALAVSACDFWPTQLEPLAESISRQVSGQATAWLAAGDVVVINVTGSPRYHEAPEALEALATDIAGQAVAFVSAPLESIAITFHEGQLSDDAAKTREFIFLVLDGRPVLQPTIDLDATGPLSPDEIQAAIDRLGETVPSGQRECVRGEMARRAHAAGDPESLDPASVELLPAETWGLLDAFGKRLALSMAITTKALFVCASAPASTL